MGGNLTGENMKVYVGIDMAKDGFNYCIMDDDLNTLYKGNNCKNEREAFDSLGKILKQINQTTRQLFIGMESTGIYHLPLYQYLRSSGYHVRILNGLEARGMKNFRVRKTSNDEIDAESISRYLMITNAKDSYDYPEELKNLKELVTAYTIITRKISTTKNNIIRVMDMLFRGLSNILDLDEDTIKLLERYNTAEEFLEADDKDLEKYITKARIRKIRSIAERAPLPLSEYKALKIEMQSLLRILTIQMEEKERITKEIEKEFSSLNNIITSISGIGTITGAIIIAKIGNIQRFESAEKLVAFAGIDPVIKESGKFRSERSISKRGDPVLRTAIYQSTLVAIRCNPVISEFYYRLVGRGMPKKKALVASSRKMCHIIFSVLKNNKPFEVPERFRKEEIEQ